VIYGDTKTDVPARATATAKAGYSSAPAALPRRVDHGKLLKCIQSARQATLRIRRDPSIRNYLSALRNREDGNHADRRLPVLL
jgi:hypothetical protein